jgi:hypothetical protein
MELPIFTSALTVFLVFFIFLILFHLALVWPRNRSKRFWKTVDYFWVSIALLGLFAAVATARKMSAESLNYWAEARVKGEKTNLISALRFGTSNAVCLSFVRTEYSPPDPELKRIQAEYNEQCDWFKRANQVLQSSINSSEVVRFEAVGSPPPKGGDNYAVPNFEDAVSRYNLSIVELANISEAAHNTPYEKSLALLAPLLFAVSIALRLAKVSGELRHERAS